MLKHRNITNRINWVLDNLLPPILRDSETLMGILFFPLFGTKTKYFKIFKAKSPRMSDAQYSSFYRKTASVHLKRETDLSSLSVKTILARTKGPTVLDIGSGRGFLGKELLKAHSELMIVGADIHVPTELRQSDNPKFIQANVEALPFKDDSFDTVICTHTLEHVIHPEIVIREMRRIARKRIIVVVPRQREYRYTFDLHLNFFPYEYNLLRLMNQPNGKVQLQQNDWYYEEDQQ